jgi:hypothetical protein
VGGQEIQKPQQRLVRDNESKGAIYLPNGSNLLIIQGERLRQFLGGMDAPSIHSGYFQE